MIIKIKTLLIIGLIIIWTSNSFACKCEDPESVQESFNYSDAVFHGKVINKSLVSFGQSIKSESADSIRHFLDDNKLSLFDSEFIIRVELEIKKCYKGNIFNDTIVIYTTRTSSSCGYLGFEIGKEYIVYGLRKSYAFRTFFKNAEGSDIEKQNTFWTNQCTRTDEYNYEEAKELETLLD